MKGFAKVISNPTKTRVFGGDVADIAGKELKVLDRNSSGDCLCLLPDESGLVDVDHCDVAEFKPVETASDLIKVILGMANIDNSRHLHLWV